MSEEHDSRTEEPTERKLQDAFEKGDVPVSRELPILASLAGVLVFILVILPSRADGLAAALMRFIDDPAGWRIDTAEDATLILTVIGKSCSTFLGPIAALLMALGVLASVSQNVPRIVPSRIAPDFSRLSPSNGARRIFGPRGWTEFGKSLFKIIAVGVAVGIVVSGQKSLILGSIDVDIGFLPGKLLFVVARVVETVVIAALVIACADFTWARLLWRRDHRMSLQEIKEELRQQEGDRLVKSRLRSLRMDRSRKRMLAAVPKATMVIVNPTHYAVALRYVRAEGGAPMVVAKGMDLIALRIRAIAEEANIPVIEDQPLARSLYAAVTVDSVIPPEFYRAVAQIVHLIQQKLQAGQRLQGRQA